MKQLGFRHTTTTVVGHQCCSVCHPKLKNRAARGRRDGRKLTQQLLEELVDTALGIVVGERRRQSGT